MELSVLNLLLVLLVAWLAGRLADRIGYPSVLGELLAGILLGPPILGLLQADAALMVLAEVGILLMMLYIGMEIDPKSLGRASKAGLLAAFGGFITPFVLCYGLVLWFGGSQFAAIFVGVAAGVTSLATKSRILVDLKLLDTRIAHVMMAGALVADTLSLIIFAGVLGVAEAGVLSVAQLGAVTAKAVGFFAAAAFVGLKVIPALLGWLTIDKLGRTGVFTLVLLTGLGFAEMAELAGMHGILGAFIAGLFLRENVLGRTHAKELMHLVRDASLGFLAPVFFVTAGFAVSLDVFTTDLGLLVGIVALATVGKVIGTALFYLPTGYGWREGLTVGAGMNGRGAVEIIVAQIGLSMGLISQEIFSILVFMAIITTATVPVFLKWGVDWLRRRGELVRDTEQRQGALIVGAGPTARALGRVLVRSMPVTVVDRNAEHCALARADGLAVVQGNALDEQVLAEAGAPHVRHVLALTPNAEVNALVAQLARSTFLAPEVHILQVSDQPEGHAALIDHLGASTLFGHAAKLGNWDYWLDAERVERSSVPVRQPQAASDLLGKLQRTRPSLPLAVLREDRYLPFHDQLPLTSGDRVVLLQVAEEPALPFDRFDHLVAQCPILDLDERVTPDEFFEMAASLLGSRLGIPPADLSRRLHEREHIHSTVLMPGIAVPHVQIQGHDRFELLLARCRDGIVFPGEPEPVHTLFVLLGTDDQRTFHLRVLSAIAQVIARSDFEQDWLMAPGAEDLRKKVLYAERRRFPNETSTDPLD